MSRWKFPLVGLLGFTLFASPSSAQEKNPWRNAAEPAPMPRAKHGRIEIGLKFELGSPTPVQPWITKRMDDTVAPSERRVPIVGPIREGMPTPICEEPPSDAEVMKSLPRVPQNVPGVLSITRDDIVVVKNRKVDKIDPPRMFPLVGIAQIHHCHWECIICFTEVVQTSFPFPLVVKKQRFETIYIDKDLLHLAAADECPNGKDCPKANDAGKTAQLQAHLASNLKKPVLPAYVIEAPDTMTIEVVARTKEGTERLPVQPISGPFLVRVDGTVGLGVWGSVPVDGLTLDQAADAIRKQLLSNKSLTDLGAKAENLIVVVDVLAYNSKRYYVITEDGNGGEKVFAFPVTGNEAVLDALSDPKVIPAIPARSEIWIARPNSRTDLTPRILPVDWAGITQRGDSKSNHVIEPGDRIYVKKATKKATPATKDPAIESTLLLAARDGVVPAQAIAVATAPGRLAGTWYREAPGAVTSLTFKGDELTIVMAIHENGQPTTITFTADCAVTKDGTVHGVFTGVDVDLSKCDDEDVAQEMSEFSKQLQTVVDQPFAFRCRSNDGGLMVSNLRLANNEVMQDLNPGLCGKFKLAANGTVPKPKAMKSKSQAAGGPVYRDHTPTYSTDPQSPDRYYPSAPPRSEVVNPFLPQVQNGSWRQGRCDSASHPADRPAVPCMPPYPVVQAQPQPWTYTSPPPPTACPAPGVLPSNPPPEVQQMMLQAFGQMLGQPVPPMACLPPPPPMPQVNYPSSWSQTPSPAPAYQAIPATYSPPQPLELPALNAMPVGSWGREMGSMEYKLEIKDRHLTATITTSEVVEGKVQSVSHIITADCYPTRNAGEVLGLITSFDMSCSGRGIDNCESSALAEILPAIQKALADKPIAFTFRLYDNVLVIGNVRVPSGIDDREGLTKAFEGMAGRYKTWNPLPQVLQYPSADPVPAGGYGTVTRPSVYPQYLETNPAFPLPREIPSQTDPAPCKKSNPFRNGGVIGAALDAITGVDPSPIINIYPLGTAPSVPQQGGGTVYRLGVDFNTNPPTQRVELVPASEQLETSPRIRVLMWGGDDCRIGEEAVFTVKLTNTGSATATRIVMNAVFSNGLRHEQGSALEGKIADLAPGESKIVMLKAMTTKAGNSWCQINVSAKDCDDRTAKGMVTVVGEPSSEKGAVIGGLLGAGVGAAVGSDKDRAKELPQVPPPVNVPTLPAPKANPFRNGGQIHSTELQNSNSNGSYYRGYYRRW